MLIPKKNRLVVYSALFKDGVLCCQKDVFAPKHHDLEVPNVEAMKLLNSLKSRGYVTLQFNWQWYYYVLTDEGINFLREYLHLPADIVPNSLKKPAKPATLPSYRNNEERGDRPPRGEYRQREEGGRGGRGRGRGRGGYSQ